MYKRHEAISLMNDLGKNRIPFFFLIDFEMKNCRIYRLNEIPPEVAFEFPGTGENSFSAGKAIPFTFIKNPVPFEIYQQAFCHIQEKIQTGKTFLTNLTFPTAVSTNLSLREIYDHCHAKYKILVDKEFVCFSPESFVIINHGVISTYPMKGTIPAAIAGAAGKIMDDSKEKAEHVTVVDLLRNDLSRISSEVSVKRFRYIDCINTHEGDLLQVSSEICGTLSEDYHKRLGEIMFSLLPAGSVTGAPKYETLNIIRQAEGDERGYYTGVCGIYDGNNLDSAVLIRFIENHGGTLRFRSGGGITFLSEAKKEYQELIDKVYVPIIGNH